MTFSTVPGWEAQTKGNEMTIATCPNCGIRETIYVRDGGELVCRTCKKGDTA